MVDLIVISLLVYFSNQRVFGLEMHIATFYRRLALQGDVHQPHKALLYAIVSIKRDVLADH